MLLADVGGEKRPPKKTGERGTCPGCGEPVMAKCGELLARHWAHLASCECDAWWEPEGEWHRTWKRDVAGDDPAKMEVTVREGDRWHRADALAADGWVVELQHSPLAPADVREREDFYTRNMGGMVWVFDYTGRTFGRRWDARLDGSSIALVDVGHGEVWAFVRSGQRDHEVERFATWTRDEVVEMLRTRGAVAVVEAHDAYVAERERRKEEARAAEARKRAEAERLLREKEEERRRIAETSRANLLSRQGGALLARTFAYPDIRRHLSVHGWITASQAHVLLMHLENNVHPSQFPPVRLTLGDADSLPRVVLRDIWPYLEPESEEHLTAEAERRRRVKAGSTQEETRTGADDHPILAKLLDARKRGALSEVTNLLCAAPREVVLRFYEIPA